MACFSAACPMDFNTITSITMPAHGLADDPIEASVGLILQLGCEKVGIRHNMNKQNSIALIVFF
jgi:hypothetical protein